MERNAAAGRFGPYLSTRCGWSPSGSRSSGSRRSWSNSGVGAVFPERIILDPARQSVSISVAGSFDSQHLDAAPQDQQIVILIGHRRYEYVALYPRSWGKRSWGYTVKPVAADIRCLGLIWMHFVARPQVDSPVEEYASASPAFGANIPLVV